MQTLEKSYRKLKGCHIPLMVIHSNWNIQSNNLMTLHYTYLKNSLGAGEGEVLFVCLFVLEKLTIPALYPGLDKVSRPMEG